MACINSSTVGSGSTIADGSSMSGRKSASRDIPWAFAFARRGSMIAALAKSTSIVTIRVSIGTRIHRRGGGEQWEGKGQVLVSPTTVVNETPGLQFEARQGVGWHRLDRNPE